MLVIYCCNKASNRIVTRSKELVFYSWMPLSPEVSGLSPYTQQHTRTSRTFYTFALITPPQGGYLCFTVPIAGRELVGQVPLRLLAELQQRRRLHTGTSVLSRGGPLRISKSTAGDGGTSDTRTTPRLYHSIKREHIDCVSGS